MKNVIVIVCHLLISQFFTILSIQWTSEFQTCLVIGVLGCVWSSDFPIPNGCLITEQPYKLHASKFAFGLKHRKGFQWRSNARNAVQLNEIELNQALCFGVWFESTKNLSEIWIPASLDFGILWHLAVWILDVDCNLFYMSVKMLKSKLIDFFLRSIK